MEEKSGQLKVLLENIAKIVLIVATVIIITLLIVDVVDGRIITSPKLVLPPVSEKQVTKNKSANDYKASLQALFQPEGENSPSRTSASSDDATPSSLVLSATFIGDFVSIAIINDGKEEKVVSEGDFLGDMQVMSIEKDRIVIDLNGKRQVARMMYNEKLDFRDAEASDKSDDGGGPGTVVRDVSRREFASLLDPPDRIAKDVALAPISRDGKPYGIQLTYVKPDSFMQRMGFQPGDVLININNKALLTPEDGLMAYQMLKNEDRVDFRVDRGGRFFQLQINFN